MKLFEEKLHRQIKFEGQLVDVYQDEILIHETGQKATREVVNHIGGVCVAARTHDNKFLMVRQYRYAQEAVGLEFIAGKKEPNEDPFVSIQRELLEEGGAIAKNWQPLGETFPSPAYLNEMINLYYADDLEFVGQQLEEQEIIQLEQLTLDEIINKIEQNEIQDLKTIALAYRLQHELNKVENRELYSQRLVLKPIRLSDSENIYHYFNEEIIQYLFPTVNESLEATSKVVENMIAKRQQHLEYVYTIRLKDSDEFLGVISLHHLDKESPEIGIWLKKDAHHNKYGQEATKTLIKLAKALGYQSLLYPVDHRNIASTKIPELFNGKIIKSIQPMTALDGRHLEIVTYEIKPNEL